MTSRWFALLSFVSLVSLVLAAPVPQAIPRVQRRTIELPIRVSRNAGQRLERRGRISGSAGLGDLDDLIYTVAMQVGNTTTSVILDTGSSDLWVKADTCHTDSCSSSTSPAYATGSARLTGASVDLRYGDSDTGTHAEGPVVLDTVGLAGISMEDQPFAAVNDTNNSAVDHGSAGLFGLGFPSQSFVQGAVVNQNFNTPSDTDDFIHETPSLGPLISRMAMSGHLDQPMFSITLQRNKIDAGGNGSITIGSLPTGVDSSSITWVPVRLYNPNEGGQNPPTFAPNEIYPLRWEVPLDAVYLDGQKLANSTISSNGLSSNSLSALIDSGNSLIRGPADVVGGILKSISSQYAANPSAKPVMPCSTPHTLAFQIGGKMFPVDPRDFVSSGSGNTDDCVADTIVPTDPPSPGTLFSWSLGDPFLKSNTVVFYYGNLTHPSVDPPRIGFLSNVPQNANQLLQQAVAGAQANGGNFNNKPDATPTMPPVMTTIPASTLGPLPERFVTYSALPTSDSRVATSAALSLLFTPPLSSYWHAALSLSLLSYLLS